MHQASHSPNMQPPCPASRRLSQRLLCLPFCVCALLKSQPERVPWPSLGPEPTPQPMLERRKCCWWSKNKQTRENTCSQRRLKDLKEMRGKSDRPVAVWVRDPKHPNSWFSIAFHVWNTRNPLGMMETGLGMQKERSGLLLSFRFHHPLTVQPWAGHLSGLSCFIYKMMALD